jgi:two-component system, LytTR family, sensor histidine kinase AlgZ
MHPILSNRKTFILYLAVWLFIGLLIEIPYVYSLRTQWIAILAADIPLNLFFATVCLSSYFLCKIYPIKTTKWYNLITMFIVVAGAASGFAMAVGYGWVHVIDSLQIALPIAPMYEPWITGIFSLLVLIFLLVATMHYVIIAFEQTQEAERQTLELQVLAQDAELRALRAQIDPHFLFNSLNSISALTAANPERARTMIILLADFFRNSLDLGTKGRIKLSAELALIDKFLTIEQVRFGSRLKVEQNVEKDTLDCRIPPLLLQPLLENAVRHGISQLVDGGTILLKTRLQNNKLIITIENPFDPDYVAKKGTGLGVKNVRSRIQTLYGSEGRIEINKANDRFNVELTFPLEG